MNTSIINTLESQIKELTKLVKKERTDKGAKRIKYNSNIPQHYKTYLARANKKQFAFEFTVEEFNHITSLDCFYCGGFGGGIDRINSLEGYLKDNCLPCCTKCNIMKHTSTQADFLNKCKKIYLKHFR